MFVILNERYVKSAFCMYELMEVWRNCKMADDESVRPSGSSACQVPKSRLRFSEPDYAVFWKQEFTELDSFVREHGPNLLGEADFKRYRMMQDFAHRRGRHACPDRQYALPAERARIELIKHGFDDQDEPRPRERLMHRVGWKLPDREPVSSDEDAGHCFGPREAAGGPVAAVSAKSVGGSDSLKVHGHRRAEPCRIRAKSQRGS